MSYENEIERSKGISLDIDIELIASLLTPYLKEEKKILDIGCGQGDLIKEIKNRYSNQTEISGMDLIKYDKIENYTSSLYLQNLNQDFSLDSNSFDIIIASHVILYLENIHHFLREINKILKTGGVLIIANPNPDSLRSILSFFMRGYRVYASPGYPLHINTPSVVECDRAVNLSGKFKKIDTYYNGFGYIPGLSISWQKILPFFKGKRFSDAFISLYCKEE